MPINWNRTWIATPIACRHPALEWNSAQAVIRIIEAQPEWVASKQTKSYSGLKDVLENSWRTLVHTWPDSLHLLTIRKVSDNNLRRQMGPAELPAKLRDTGRRENLPSNKWTMQNGSSRRGKLHYARSSFAKRRNSNSSHFNQIQTKSMQRAIHRSRRTKSSNA